MLQGLEGRTGPHLPQQQGCQLAAGIRTLKERRQQIATDLHFGEGSALRPSQHLLRNRCPWDALEVCDNRCGERRLQNDGLQCSGHISS